MSVSTDINVIFLLKNAYLTSKTTMIEEWMRPPKTRKDCENIARPCPHILCKYHLWPITRKSLDELPKESCCLDIAEYGGLTLEEIGQILGLTRERIRQIEISAIRKLIIRDQKSSNKLRLLRAWKDMYAGY